MVAEGNHKLDDVLPIYRRKNAALSAAGAAKDSSGGSSGATTGAGQTDKPIKYFVVDGVEALGKFGADAWFVPVPASNTALSKSHSRQGPSHLRYDNWASVAIQTVQMARSYTAVSSW